MRRRAGRGGEREGRRKGKGRHTPLLPGPGEMAARRSTDEMRERVVLGEFGVRNVRGAGRGRVRGAGVVRGVPPR